MEKINTDYKQPIWKTEAELFNVCKASLSSYKEFMTVWIFLKNKKICMEKDVREQGLALQQHFS